MYHGYLNTSDLFERNIWLKDSTNVESRMIWDVRIRTFWISKSVLTMALDGYHQDYLDPSFKIGLVKDEWRICR